MQQPPSQATVSAQGPGAIGWADGSILLHNGTNPNVLASADPGTMPITAAFMRDQVAAPLIRSATGEDLRPIAPY